MSLEIEIALPVLSRESKECFDRVKIKLDGAEPSCTSEACGSIVGI